MMGKNILILTYWNYKDALVQTYTLPYVKMIAQNLGKESKIFFVTFDKGKIDSTADLDELGITHISFTYKGLGVKSVLIVALSIFKLLFLIKKYKISYIHAWCASAGALGYLLSIFTKTKLVIDSFEPHAESMLENGTWKKSGLPYKMLFKLEKLQAHKATYLIAAAEGMKLYAKEKYAYEGSNYFVKPACVNLNLFQKAPENIVEFRKRLKIASNDVVAIYAGKFGGIYLNEEIYDFLKVAYDYWKGRFKVIILSNETKERVMSGCKNVGLPMDVVISLFVPHNEIPQYMNIADFAINPVKPVPSKRYCTSIKDGEYWAMGLPVVITKGISDDSEIIERENIGAVIASFDNRTYLKVVKKIDALLLNELPEVIKERVRNVAIKYRSFEIAENIYRTIYLG